ncbi:MAG: carbamoyltransferase [Candidatus Eisenbacteria sp.]|nr:carbamoyltransferase [Candidatus Eisenbacteria bacterium]
MQILGVSCFYHDSAAVLVREGEIVAAAQEERFTRRKHDARFPMHAVNYCLEEGGLRPAELDLVVFYEKPFIKFERILETYLTFAPRGFRSFLMAMPLWLKQKLWMKELIQEQLTGYEGKILFAEHHESHAASAFYPSPFEEAAILTLDGVGEWTTTSYGVGCGHDIELLAEIRFPHSLGLLYSAFTYFTGFKVNSAEYKVMGLAPYGEPKYVDVILSELVDLKEDGSFRMNMRYFDYCAGLRMTSDKLARLLGGPPRKPDDPLTQREMDLARSVQAVTEEAVLRMARHIHQVTGQRFLCLGGGVALNCVANGRLLREGPFEDLWIQPAAGDAGGALGAALLGWHRYLGGLRPLNAGPHPPRPADVRADRTPSAHAGQESSSDATSGTHRHDDHNRHADRNRHHDHNRDDDHDRHDRQRASYLGPGFTDDQLEQFLTENQLPHHRLPREELPDRIAQLIIDQHVVGWFQGRMEFGPRALGARSILGDPRSTKMQAVLNLKIKFRESFRPFAPSVLVEHVDEYFEIDRPSPYMLLVAPLQEHRRIPMTGDQQSLFGIAKLNIPRSDVPAVTHIDYTARIQSVSRPDNPLYYDMIKAFRARAGVPLVINTSFNVRGEPIVCTPEDAYKCFMRTEMDALVMGPFLLHKEEQPAEHPTLDWHQEFEPD